MVCLIEREREEENGLNIDYSILMLDNVKELDQTTDPRGQYGVARKVEQRLTLVR